MGQKLTLLNKLIISKEEYTIVKEKVNSKAVFMEHNEKNLEDNSKIVKDTSEHARLCYNDSKDVEEHKTFKTKGRFLKKQLHVDSHIKKKKHHWVLKFNCPRIRNSVNSANLYTELNVADHLGETDSCTCSNYPDAENENEVNNSSLSPSLESNQPEGEFLSSGEEIGEEVNGSNLLNNILNAEPIIDLSKFNPVDYPIEDCDERARLERAREIAEGVDPPPGFSPKQQIELVCHSDVNFDKLKALFHSALSLSALSQIDVPKSVHTQVDYIHCLVPDLFKITSCSFYWGKMDRYEAEKLLENKPEGTFLLRDSAQEEHLFSVSFRKYGRSLHARIEQWNHRFSFDSHDPGVYSSNTVCGLIKHYKDPTCCMFFEPLLTIPLHRNFTFSLQHLCRSVICDNLTYDSISYLKLPKSLKVYLKEYHYKQRVRVRKFEPDP